MKGAKYRNNMLYKIPLKVVFYFTEVSFRQYLEHVPVPVVEKEVCDSPEHYNAHLGVSDICSGARTDKPTCKVFRFYCLLHKDRYQLTFQDKLYQIQEYKNFDVKIERYLKLRSESQKC